MLNRVDRHHFGWSRDVGSAPVDAEFSFSVGGRAFFLIGMHPQALRLARRAAMPVIVFKLHEQFVEMRSSETFQGVRDAVRARDREFPGHGQSDVGRLRATLRSRSVVALIAEHGWQQQFTSAIEHAGRHHRPWGAYLDTPESAAHVDTFRANPAFRWDDYMPQPSGYRTFNQFFARHVKPGYRPVAALESPAVVVAPADAVFIGAWPVAPD